jgi:hypothetical protein
MFKLNKKGKFLYSVKKFILIASLPEAMRMFKLNKKGKFLYSLEMKYKYLIIFFDK